MVLDSNFYFYCLYCLLQIIYMWLLTANTVIKTFILWPIISGICSVKQRSISKEFLKKIYIANRRKPRFPNLLVTRRTLGYQQNYQFMENLAIFFYVCLKTLESFLLTKCVIPRFIRYHKVAWGNEHYILTGQMKKSEGNTGGSSLTKLW